MVLVGRTFEVENAIFVDDLEQGLVFAEIHVVLDLLLEGLLGVVGDQLELVAAPHEHHFFLRPQRLLGQVATLVVEQPVRVSTPSDALHQDSTHRNTTS